MVQSDRPLLTIWCMRIACWITKATNTHSQYVILIAFPLQQWLHERAKMLRYKYIVGLVIYYCFPQVSYSSPLPIVGS